MIWGVPTPTFFSAQVVEAQRVVLDLDRRRRPGLIVASAGWERCAADYRLSRRGFPWLGVELVAEGNGTLELAGVRHRLQPGSVFAYGPDVAHTILADPAELPLKYFLDLSGEAARGLLDDIGLPPGRCACLPVHAEVRTVFDLLLATGRRGGPRAARACAALAEAALQLIGDAAVAPALAGDAALATYRRCRAWLDRHGADAAGLGAAAVACGVSEAHLCRLFRRFDGVPPWRQERLRRLQRAADALLDPSRPVAAIGREAGYDDPFHFSRAFRVAFGVAPTAYRRLRGAAGTEHPAP